MSHPADDRYTRYLERVILRQRVAIVLALAATLTFLGLWVREPEPPAVGRVAYDQMAEIRKTIQFYHLDHGEYPPSLSALTIPTDDWPEGYMPEIPRDPFREPYVYRRETYVLFSKGPDREEGTSDDVVDRP